MLIFVGGTLADYQRHKVRIQERLEWPEADPKGPHPNGPPDFKLGTNVAIHWTGTGHTKHPYA